MKRSISALMLGSLVLVGCQKDKAPEAAADASVLDVQPQRTYQPAPQPVISDNPAPVTAAPAAPVAPAPAAAATASNYVVKKGDTLYSIARSHYGDGKQWQKIVAANPGLSPEKLKVGQTLLLP